MFRTILFDIDGVMLSEERYFDASALTIYELLFSPQYLQLSPNPLPTFCPAPENAEIGQIREAVFANDRVLTSMKKLGINANWDMVYLQTAFQLTELLASWREKVGNQAMKDTLKAAPVKNWSRETVQYLGRVWREHDFSPRLNFSAFQDFAQDCESKADLFEKLEAVLEKLVPDADPGFIELKVLWDLGQETFQEWYLGDAYVPFTHQSGKHGFLTEEVPLVDPNQLASLLLSLDEKGIELGIATGRPKTETHVPLEHLGWLKYFPKHRISTASDVLEAERKHPEHRPLAKPNPFSYLRSYLGVSDEMPILEHPLPLPRESGEQTLVVGDSVADLLAARKMGCRFAAVLTGLEGDKARTQFEQMGSDYILDNVLGVDELVR